MLDTEFNMELVQLGNGFYMFISFNVCYEVYYGIDSIDFKNIRVFQIFLEYFEDSSFYDTKLFVDNYLNIIKQNSVKLKIVILMKY